MYQFNVAPPEVDFLILNQMTDEDLVQFCQTDQYAQELCQIPIIKNRIETYKFYKTFDYATILNDIEQYCPYPIMIHRYELFKDETLFGIENDLFILYEDKYKSISCLTQEDLSPEGESFINIFVSGEDINKKFLTIVNEKNTDFSIWNLDLVSIYRVYVTIGLKKYAKLKTIEQLNQHYQFKLNYGGLTLKDFYNLFILRLWFISHIILYKLEDDRIENFNLDIDNQFDYQPYILRLIDDIDDLYNILFNYINQLD